MDEFHKRTSCVLCHLELTTQNLDRHYEKHIKGEQHVHQSQIQRLKDIPPSKIRELYIEHKTIGGVLTYLGIKTDSRCQRFISSTVSDILVHKKDKTHRKTDLNTRIPEILQIAPKHTCLTAILAELGIAHMRKEIIANLRDILDQHDIELASFKRRWHPDIVYVANSLFPRNGLRSRVKRDNTFEYKCTECNIEGSWNSKPLSLHLDHINGINNDHRKENLRWLCPNCHSQTDTYCVNKGKKRVGAS